MTENKVQQKNNALDTGVEAGEIITFTRRPLSALSDFRFSRYPQQPSTPRLQPGGLKNQLAFAGAVMAIMCRASGRN